MKTIMILTMLIGSMAFAYGSTYVKGYTKSNGTYVQPHYRSGSNNTVNDNWSTQGNVNPYTGKSGSKSIYDQDDQD